MRIPHPPRSNARFSSHLTFGLAALFWAGGIVACPADPPATFAASSPATTNPALASEEARRVAALSDLVTFRDAQAVVELDTLYYTSLENLDDLPGVNTFEPRDGIQDEGGAWMLDPLTGDWHPQRLLLDHPPREWNGPYVNFQNKAGDDGAGYDPGTPLDPWGRPYLLFTPLGLARPTIPDVTLEFYADQFDRWAVVSLGTDGVVSEDDLGVQFGAAPTGLVISSVRAEVATAASAAADAVCEISSTGIDTPSPPSSAPARSLASAAWQLRIRGYNFGPLQPESAVLIDGNPLSLPAASWSGTEILQPLPPGFPAGEHLLQVRIGPAVSAPFAFTFQGSPTSALSDVWSLYE